MDLNWARTLFTVCVFISFMLVLVIVMSKRNKNNYDNAAQSIMDDPDTPTGQDASRSTVNTEHK